MPIAGIRAIPDGTGKNCRRTHTAEKGLPVYRDAQLMLIGVVVLAMAFAEGSANDWLPLLMVDGHGFSPTSGSLIYAGFTLGMTVGALPAAGLSTATAGDGGSRQRPAGRPGHCDDHLCRCGLDCRRLGDPVGLAHRSASR
jgi:hypothetical protein